MGRKRPCREQSAVHPKDGIRDLERTAELNVALGIELNDLVQEGSLGLLTA